MASDLKPSALVAKIAAKANAGVGLMKRTFTYMDRGDLHFSVHNPGETDAGLWCPVLVPISSEGYK